jgi:aspartate aminotransferase-like enzyme
MPPELPTLVEQLKQRYGIIVARGQEQYHSQLVRIGHCGWYSQEDLAALADAFEELMPHR